MSANRTRLLFADDTDILARARSGMVSRPEFDVVMAASTDEALQLAADSTPGAVVLPADGEIDGLQVCRTVKAAANGRSVVILALPADGSSKRDACFAAGADDVLFAPVEAADIASRLDRTGSAFRGAPRAEVELVIRLASPTGSAVIDARGMQISREAVQVALPQGTPVPPSGQLVRAVFTLYEGGTLQVWARVAPTGEMARTVLRFVGLTEAERKAIDYFVDFYVKQSGAAPANGRANGSSPEELLLSAEIPDAPEAEELILSDHAPQPAMSASAAAIAAARSGSAAAAAAAAPAQKYGPGDLVRLIGDASIDELATAAGVFANGRETKLPDGFDPGRFRASIAKLSPTEAAALRGTTTYPSMLEDLQYSSAERTRLAEMIAVLRDGGSRVDKRTTEQIVLTVLSEAQQIHAHLDSAFQELIKAGNTAAMKDLQPVKQGLLTACVELKATLDRDVLGKDAPGAARTPAKTATQTKFDPPPKEVAPKQKEKTSSTGKKPGQGPESSKGPTIAMGLVALVLLAGAAWSNRYLFLTPPPPPPFRAETVLFEVQGVRVWTSAVDQDSVKWVIDGTWAGASEEARKAAIEEIVKRSAPAKHIKVLDYQGKEIASREL